MSSILEAKFCPLCAGRLEPRLVDDKERLVCRECGFILYINPKVAAGALVEDDGKVVLVKRGVEPQRGAWALPSGFAEYEESIEETAIRETWEETGLEIELDALLGVYSYSNEVVGRGVLVLFRGHVVGGEIRAGDDAEEVRRFGPEELPENIAFATHREALREWKKARAVVVRPATRAEAPQVAAIRREHAYSWERDYAQFVEAPDRELFVAVEGHRVVGFATVSLQQRGVTWLDQLFVLPQYRRWGIATRLIHAALEFARAHGTRALVAIVPANNPGLIVYLKAGFRVAGFDDTYYPEERWGTSTGLYLAYDLETRTA